MIRGPGAVWWFGTTLVTAAAGFIMLQLMTGSPAVDLAGVVAAFRAPSDDLLHLVVVDLRLPRALLALLAGGALGLAGALMQDGLRNPLAAPELLGVTGGASLIVAIVAVLHVPLPRELLPLAATIGGLAVGAAVLAVGRRSREPSTLVLVGLAASAFLNGAIVAVVTLGAPSDVGLFYQYLLGSLANRSWDAVATVAPWILVGLPLGLLFAPQLNAMRLGDDVASGLGIPVARTRMLIIGLCCLLAACVVAVCGPIGFIALLAPHIVRLVTGQTDARLILPLSLLVGSVLLLGADTIGRVLTQPREIAVGVWTVLLGAPALLALLHARRSA